MINENRVKKIYKIALYEQKEEKENRSVEHYYRSDYVGKEIIKSFFTGTIAYVVMVLLWIMGNWAEILRQINSLQIFDTVVTILILYAVFLLIYLIVTSVVYNIRYKHYEKQREAYLKNVKRVYQMYEREEKLKM